jgi:tRNA (guanine37-N1)-methyltransferase
MIRFDILTIFPEMFESSLKCSILKKAIDRGIVDVHLHDIREYALDRHRMTDDAPYGGGGGMVMKVEPIDRALGAVPLGGEGVPVVLLTPQGEPFCNRIAKELAENQQVVMVCGHYEGVDERVRKYLINREISIGDYILTGGEISAMVLLDAVSRFVPGVLGNSDSAAADSFSAGLLEHPHYTRPPEYRGWVVPEVLLSGNHREIEEWRRRQSVIRTKNKRPELIEKAGLTDKDRMYLAEQDDEN